MIFSISLLFQCFKTRHGKRFRQRHSTSSFGRHDDKHEKHGKRGRPDLFNELINQYFLRPTQTSTAEANTSAPQTNDTATGTNNASANVGTNTTNEQTESGVSANAANQQRPNLSEEALIKNAEYFAKNAKASIHLFSNIASNFASMLDPFAQSLSCPASNADTPNTPSGRCPFAPGVSTSNTTAPSTTGTCANATTTDNATAAPISSKKEAPITFGTPVLASFPDTKNKTDDANASEMITIVDIEDDSDEEVLRDLSERVNGFQNPLNENKNEQSSTGAVSKTADASSNEQNQSKDDSSSSACLEWMLVDDDGHVVGESQPGISTELKKVAKERTEVDYQELSRLLKKQIISPEVQLYKTPEIANQPQPKQKQQEQAQTASAPTSSANESTITAQAPPFVPSAPIMLHPGKTRHFVEILD